jgi:hypothetical protein
VGKWVWWWGQGRYIHWYWFCGNVWVGGRSGLQPKSAIDTDELLEWDAPTAFKVQLHNQLVIPSAMSALQLPVLCWHSVVCYNSSSLLAWCASGGHGPLHLLLLQAA